MTKSTQMTVHEILSSQLHVGEVILIEDCHITVCHGACHATLTLYKDGVTCSTSVRRKLKHIRKMVVVSSAFARLEQQSLNDLMRTVVLMGLGGFKRAASAPEA